MSKLGKIGKIDEMDDDNCLVGRMPTYIADAKLGDFVEITTNEGKTWIAKVTNKTSEGLSLENEFLRFEYSYSLQSIEIYLPEQNYSAQVVNIEIRNMDIVELINYPKDDEGKHLSTLIMLHLRRLNKEQKIKLIECFSDILGIKRILSNFKDIG